MTNREALIVEVGIQVSDAMISKGLADAGLQADDLYTNSDELLILKTAGSILFNASLLKSISEGGYSISFDREAILARLRYLARRTGDNSLVNALVSQPKITSVKRW